MDLAGNAFHSGCASAAVLVQFAVLGFGYHKKGCSVKVPASMESFVDGESDIDFDLDSLVRL